MRSAFWIARISAVMVFLFSLVVVVGYLSGQSALYRPTPDGAATHPITVVMTAWLGSGLLLVSPIRRLDRAARLLFLFAAGLAAARLVEMTLFDPGQAVLGSVFEGLAETLQHVEAHGNTGLNTLSTGILIALGQLLRSRLPRPAMIAAALAPLAPLVAVFGYTFGFVHFHGEMSPITAALLLPLSLIGLTSFVRRPVLRPLFAGTAFGRGARVEILAGIGFPWTLGAVLAHSETGETSNTAIQSALMAMFAVTMVLVKTRAHAGTERQRQRTVRALQQAAVTDHLTGVSNRHGAMKRIDALAAKRPVGVILVDLDHFKQINDVWGHVAGDRILVDVARFFRDSLRSKEIVARWGGEEFLVVLPGRDVDATARVAERLRTGLAMLNGPDGELGGITASFGVSERYDRDVTLDDAIHRADVALYNAKECGRDRVAREDRCAGCAQASRAAFGHERVRKDRGAAA